MKFTIKKESLELERLSINYNSKNKGLSTFIIENNTIYFQSGSILNIKNLPDNNKEFEKIEGLLSFDFYHDKRLQKKHLEILINNDLDVYYKNNIDFDGIEINCCNNQDISYFIPKNYATIKINYLRFIDNLNNELENYNYNDIICTRNNKNYLEKMFSDININLDSLKKSIKFLELKKEQHFYIYSLENCFVISPINLVRNLKDCKYLSIIYKERKCKNEKNVL